MKHTPYTISTLIDDLTALYHQYGDIEALDTRGHSLFAHHVELVKVDDWDHSTQTEDGEIPGVGFAVQIGRR